MSGMTCECGAVWPADHASDCRLDAALRELERTDPEVRAAREALDKATEPYESWRRGMVRSVWGQA